MEKTERKKSNLRSEEVYQFLRNKLITLEFQPGYLLSENELVSKFNFSRTPVRYALSKMERDGLVEIVPRKGALIKYLSMKDVREIFQIRKSLESTAAGLAIDNLDLKVVKKFEEFYSKLLRGTANQNLRKISSVGMDFHDFLIVSAGNQRIKKILDDLKVQLSICRMFFLNQNPNVRPSRAIEAIEEHLSIIDALKKGDRDLAEARMKNHLINAESYTLSSG